MVLYQTDDGELKEVRQIQFEPFLDGRMLHTLGSMVQGDTPATKYGLPHEVKHEREKLLLALQLDQAGV